MKYKVLSIKKKLVLLSLLYFLFIILSTPRVQAASFDLSVSPPILQIELTPPAVVDVKESLTLENTSDNPLAVDIKLQPFTAGNDESGIIKFLSSNDEIPGADPLILQRIRLLENGEEVKTLTLSPKQSKKLDLKITIPKDEPPSDYYFAILFVNATEGVQPLTQENKGLNPSNNENSGTQMTGGIGVSVLLSIGPKGLTNGRIEEFSTPFFQERSPVPFTVRVRNTSNHFIYPEGQIVIKNMFGQPVGVVDLLPVNILTNSIRALPSKENFIFAAQENPQSLSKNDKKLIEQYQKIAGSDPRPKALWNGGFLLGPYSATITLALSEEGPLLTKTVHFFAFPMYIAVSLLVAASIILFVRHRLKTKPA